MQLASRTLLGLKPCGAGIVLLVAEPETKAATASISELESWPANDGIPPPPDFTCWTTWSRVGFSVSRFGPSIPVEPAAWSV